MQGLAIDREVRRDADGTAHFVADDGLALGLRVFTRRPVVSAPDPINAVGAIKRLNQHRKWKARAIPKAIQHVVFATPDYEASWAFFRDRLNFRLTDLQGVYGVFARADGTNDHHNIYFLNAHLPGMGDVLSFNHANFTVDDIDEVMIGANHMERQGWQKSVHGLGRHRIASSLFLYLPCPAGGQAEYGADSDYLDDHWIPRRWEPTFGFVTWVQNLPPFLMSPAAWDVGFAEGFTPEALASPAGTADPSSC